MLSLRIKFPHIPTSLNYRLLCKQRHCIQSWNEEKKKVTWEKRKLLVWKCGSGVSGCAFASVAGNHFSAEGSVRCSLSGDPCVLGSSAARPPLGPPCMPSTGSQTRMQRCSPKKSKVICPRCVTASSSVQWAFSSTYIFLENIDYCILQNFSLSVSKSRRYRVSDKRPELWNWIFLHQEKDGSILRGLWFTGMKLSLLYPILYMSRAAKQRITF